MLPALPEDLDVRVPEAVDGLELVPDGEDLGDAGLGDEVDELALETIRVLELVHHDEAEARPDGISDVLMGSEEVASVELQILEVEDRLGALRGRVLGGVAVEELLEEVPIARGERLEISAMLFIAAEI
ncbi:MAG: hypothetical protein RMM28_01530, partial [Thermoleophilia bacterium]|nr:hypothetical protein [Thermoleophilia bacterium]